MNTKHGRCIDNRTDHFVWCFCGIINNLGTEGVDTTYFLDLRYKASNSYESGSLADTYREWNIIPETSYNRKNTL